MRSISEAIEDRKECQQKLKEELPDLYGAFRSLLESTYKDGHLPRKTKEIAAIASSVAIQSESCVLAHVKKALDAGATRGEILEASAIGVEMGGGPSLAFAKKAIDVADALLK
ncbi:MAG: carboxymuconolactone decarboxylase family protein [Thermoplasmata archaeon]